MPVAEDIENALHAIVKPKLYLAFTRDETVYESTFEAQFSRIIQGSFNHVEIVFEIGRVAQRVIVPRPSKEHPAGRVFRTFAPFAYTAEWCFLRVPCTHEQVRISAVC